MKESNPPSINISRSSIFSEETISIFAQQKYFFSALYEFSQCSPPQVLWEIGDPLPVEKATLMNCVANTPIDVDTDPWTQNLSFIISQVNSLHYISVHMQILDCDARGFVRTLIFVIANQSKDIIISTYYKQKNAIISFCHQLQESASKQFFNDFTLYISSLLKLINTNSDKILNSKMKELQPLLERYQIDTEHLEISNAPDRYIEYFTAINNQLRPLKDLICLDPSKVESFILSLPNTPILSSLLAGSNYVQPKPSIVFTDAFENYGDFVFKVLSHDYDNSQFKLIDLVPRKAFFYCAFTVLSGHTLVIKYSNPEKVVSLAERFSIISPFCKKNYIGFFKKAKPIDCIKYAICVVQDLENDQKNLVSLLDLSRMVYSGDGCPPHSFVSTLGKCENISETSFVLNLYSTVNRYASNFITKLAEISEKGPIAKDKLMSALKDVGFNKDDKPIIKYWLHCYFNKQNLKPILNNNMSRGGLTMITL